MLEAVARVFRSEPSVRIEALARLIADESVPLVTQLVAHHMEGMTLSEARGYVRARSAKIVHQKARQVIGQHSQATPEWLAPIIRSATERLVPLVMRRAGVGIPRRIDSRVAA